MIAPSTKTEPPIAGLTVFALSITVFLQVIGATTAFTDPATTMWRGLISCRRYLSWSDSRAVPTRALSASLLGDLHHDYVTAAGEIPHGRNELVTPVGTRMPKIVHRVLTAKDVKPRVIVVGDIHGCLDELQDLLDKCKYHPQNDTVVLVGDLVNKGPKSVEVVSYARRSGFLVVRGNHDDDALAAYHVTGRYKGGRPHYYSYVERFTQDDVAWLDSLPYSLTLSHMGVVIVHAGVLPGLPLAHQDPSHLTRIRNVLEEDDGTLVGKEHPKAGVAWVDKWQGPELIVFGHDAKRKLQRTTFATGLDTGCCYGGELTAQLFPSRELVSVKAREVYAPIKDKSGGGGGD